MLQAVCLLTRLLLLLACVDGVHGDLVLGGISDEALSIREADIRRRGAVALRRRNIKEDKYQAKQHDIARSRQETSIAQIWLSRTWSLAIISTRSAKSD